MPELAATTAVQVAAVQRRTVRILAAGQVLGGVALGATVSLGALLAVDLAGQDAVAGFATASLTLGAALCAIPLARLAAARGRRLALSLGNLFALVGVVLIVAAAALRLFPLLLVGILLVGAGNAGNLQSRFAATDLAPTHRRGRDLSVVVWATTVGGVLGPLMLAPGEALGGLVGMPPLTGAYLFSFAAQAFAFVLYMVGLRPDPLLTARRLATEGEASREHIVEADRPLLARYAIFAVAASHVVMAGVMAMTPVHLSHVAAPDAVTWVVGVTVALHVFGMYGLSPVFGVLADRWGRVPVIVTGQALFVGSLVTAAALPESELGILIALLLLGLGWSAATVAGAALLTEVTPTLQRPRRQGLSDTFMTLSAAIGSILAGLVLGATGYAGVALSALGIVLAVVVTTIVVSVRSRKDADAAA